MKVIVEYILDMESEQEIKELFNMTLQEYILWHLRRGTMNMLSRGHRILEIKQEDTSHDS